MSDLDRIRVVALLLPESEERDEDGACAFAVDGRVYAEVRGATLRVRAATLPGTPADVDAGEAWTRVALGGDTDWVLVEDLLARGWEMSAPRRLLEAGGR